MKTSTNWLPQVRRPSKPVCRNLLKQIAFILKRSAALLVVFLGCLELGKAAGITIITHGFELSPLDKEHGWVEAMGDSIADRATGTPYIYRLVVASDLTASITPQNPGVPPIEQSQNAEIIVKVYWDQAAGLLPPVGTYYVAQAIYPKLTSLAHASELPIHLIGHSRGSSLITELARLYGKDGIWVHQFTTLDPHPIAIDVPVQVWENVLFADNYYEANSDEMYGTIPVPNGSFVNGAYYKFLSLSPGSYAINDGGAHSDIHLWYHGTINQIPAASDGNVSLTSAMRQNWYLPDIGQGQFSGFYFSRLGGGLTDDNGPYFGLYNEGDFNNSPDNRIALAVRNPNGWPNLIQLAHDGVGSVQAGNAFHLKYVFQSRDSGSSVTLYLDPDQNPYNHNEIPLTGLTPAPDLSATALGTRAIDINGTVPSSTPGGSYYIYGKINNANGARYLYSVNKIQVNSAGSTVPSISSVYPTTMVTSASPQPFQILGSGFTSSSTLLFNGSIVSQPARLHFKNENEIDYDLIVQSGGPWFVQVVNGAQNSTAKTFTVNVPSPTTGQLVVNLSPAGIGSQWQVDGTGYNNSGQVVGYLSSGLHTVTFKPVSGYATPANLPVNIVANQQASVDITYAAVASTTYALTLTAANGTVTPSPSGWNGSAYVYNSGSVVQLTAVANYGYHFTGWSGDLSGSISPANITMNAAKSVTANFASGDLNLATIAVTIQPSAAGTAGAQWKHNSSDWMNSGDSFNTTLLGGNYNYIQFKSVPGWIAPSSVYVNVTGGQTTNLIATYQQDMTPGLLTVTLSPPDAVTAGAHWNVNGGAYGNGAAVSLPPGTYNVTFDTISGWSAPSSQQVTIQPSGTKAISGNYTPPAGQPIIGSISPPIGPMTGESVMTINGANFALPVGVLVGGRAVSNLSVTSSTQITCQTPPSTNYGSASVIVQTGSGNVTNLNGFAYGISRGTNLDLVSAVGGRVYAVDAQGSYAYVGEGRNLLVLNVSSPSNPSKVGQVTLPGIISDLKIFGQYAYVADGDVGLQVVDISDPTKPLIRGFYLTTNYMNGIAVLGGDAYVADSAGLKIFDLANPIAPTLLSSTDCGDSAYDVVVRASGAGVFAYVTTGGSIIRVIDVSNPLSPILRGQTSVGGDTHSIAVSGNYLFAASIDDGLHMVDVSNPDAPADIGHSFGGGLPWAVATANNYVYAANNYNGFYVFSISGSTLTLVGHITAPLVSGFNMTILNNRAYIAGGDSGFEIVDVSSAFSPTALATFTDSGMSGWYQSVGASGNALCTLVEGGAFKVFDITQPAQPVLAGQLSNLGGFRQLLARNGVAYVTSASQTTSIIGISTPSSPQLLATIPNSAVFNYKMALAGNTLFVAGQNGSAQPRLVVIDISNPSSPFVRGSKDFTSFDGGSFAGSLAVVGNKVVVGIQANSGTSELSILDVSNLNSPTETATMTDFGYPFDIQMSSDGKNAFVASGSSIYVLSVTNAAAPVTLTNIAIDASSVRSLAIQGSELYAATVYGVYCYDVSQPSIPKLTRSFLISGVWLYGIGQNGDSGVQNGLIYLADTGGGAVTLKEKDNQNPSVFITNPTFSPTYSNATSTVNLGGGSDDNVGIAAMTWSNNRGGSGQVSAPFDSWYVSGIQLYPGSNILTVTAFDAAGNSGNKALTVIHPVAKQNQIITFPSVTNHSFGDLPITLAATASSGLPVSFTVVSGPANISGNVLTLTGAGDVTVEGSQSGNDLFNPATPVDVSFNVARANQSIDFALLPDKSAGDAEFALSAIASSGLSVYFSVISGPAIINNNTLSLVGSGGVTVVAWQPGNSNYNAAATVQRNFNVSKIPQTISFGAMSPQKVGDAPFSLNAVASSGLPVGYSISGPATLSGNIVTINGPGVVTLTASQPGDSFYSSAANVAQAFSVSPPDNTLVGLNLQNNAGFQFAFYGVLNSNYSILVSSNLMNWQPFTNFVVTNSPTYFTDPAGTNSPKRFYRATTP